jgi:hypothetical protein
VPQIGEERHATAVSIVRALAHRLGDDFVDLRRYVAGDRADLWRIFLEVGPDHGGIGVPSEGHPSRKALIHDAAKRVNVHATIDLFPFDLLRGHVIDGADELTCAGDSATRGRMLGQAEIGQINVILPVGPGTESYEDVRGFNVPMHEAEVVSSV